MITVTTRLHREGAKDGKEILKVEKQAFGAAQLLGKGMSAEIKNKINLSSLVDDPEDATIKATVDTSYEISHPVIERSEADLRDRVSQPVEYTSIYGSGGYNIPEYKSIYDE